MVVCPGFIDIQSHSIVPLMVDGRCLSKITQGVTTEIMGEGWTPAPVGGRNLDDAAITTPYADLTEWREKRDAAGRASATGWRRRSSSGVSPNVGSFLGGGTLRQYGRGHGHGPVERRASSRRCAG